MNYIEANWGVVSLNYGENGEKNIQLHVSLTCIKVLSLRCVDMVKISLTKGISGFLSVY